MPDVPVFERRASCPFGGLLTSHIQVMHKIDLIKFLDRWLGSLLVCVLPRPYLLNGERLNRQSILLIRPGGIGDALLLAPSIIALRRKFPEAAIDVLAEQRNAGAFALIPGLREILDYDCPATLVRVLRRRYDVVIDTEQWHRLSAVICRLIRSKIKIGFATNERARMFTHPVNYDLDNYEVQSFLDLLAPLGIDVTDSAPSGRLVIPAAVVQQMTELLRPIGRQPFLALFTGASIPEKRWAAENFREVIDWCLAGGLAVVLVGGASDASVNEAIASGRPILNLAGRTSLAGTAAILERAACVVSGDSGVLHLAAGLNRPTVALFGPSNARKWAPRGPGHIVFETASSCSPCSKFGYTPPCSDRVRCLAELTPAEVCRAIANLRSHANK